MNTTQREATYYHTKLLLNLDELIRTYDMLGRDITSLNEFRFFMDLDIFTVQDTNTKMWYGLERLGLDTKASIMEDIYRYNMDALLKENIIELACNILTDFIQLKAALRKYLASKTPHVKIE